MTCTVGFRHRDDEIAAFVVSGHWTAWPFGELPNHDLGDEFIGTASVLVESRNQLSRIRPAVEC
ncbi:MULTISPECIES: hypothetical protein [unclassified Nonomuraea]